MDSSPNWLVALMFAAFFVAMWVFVCWLLGHASGWVRLARLYPPANGCGEGTAVRMRLARLGRSGLGQFRNVVTAFTGAGGLRLRMQFLFRVNTRDIFVPWSDVTVGRGRAFLVEYVDLTFARAPEIPLRVWGRSGDRLREAAGSRWPEATGVGLA